MAYANVFTQCHTQKESRENVNDRDTIRELVPGGRWFIGHTTLSD